MVIPEERCTGKTTRAILQTALRLLAGERLYIDINKHGHPTVSYFMSALRNLLISLNVRFISSGRSTLEIMSINSQNITGVLIAKTNVIGLTRMSELTEL